MRSKQPESFYEVVTAAVADLATHGYDSQARVDDWSRRLREAATRDLVPEGDLHRLLRAQLGQAYERLVERGGALRQHPGLPRFTLERVKPRLRAELDRRIAASANLIRLNRQQAIEDTLQRFQGWATSIPPGGSDAIRKNPVKSDVRKALASLPFRERRVAVDQGHKLLSNLSNILATDGGAIAGVWHQHYTNNPRHAHKLRNNKVYLIRGNWAHERGLVKPGPVGYTDEITAPGEEVFCLPGDSLIPFADGVEVAYRRWYSGELTEIATSSNKSFRVTPNHPVLTLRGWIAAGSLEPGDYVIQISEEIARGPIKGKLDRDDAVASIAEVFAAVKGLGITKEIRGSSEQFHGDGTDSNVDVVGTNRPLIFGRKPLCYQGIKEFLFAVTTHPRLSSSHSYSSFFAKGSATKGFMGWFYKSLSLLGRQAGPSISHMLRSYFLPSLVRISNQAVTFLLGGTGVSRFCSFATVPESYSVLVQDIVYDSKVSGITNQFFSNRRSTQARSIHLDDSSSVEVEISQSPSSFRLSRVVGISKVLFSGHVFNLQTRDGWYVGPEGIIFHNCRCTYQYVYAIGRLPAEMLTQKGRNELARVRAEIAA